MEKKTCIFMGTPQIAADVLEALLRAQISVDLVVSQPDKKVGRKQTIVYSPVKQLAVEHGIECFQPVRIRDDYQPILDLHPDVIITCAYGQMVPDAVLQAPTYGCVNLHGSLLPKYRGGAPIQRAIWNGETQTGMSLMKMVPAMDAGPVLAQKAIDILPEDCSGSLFDKLGKLAGSLIVEQFEHVCSPTAVYQQQNEAEVTYAPIIKKEEERIDLNQEDQAIFNQIRALSWTPGAYVYLHGKKWKILKASYRKEKVQTPFEVLGLQQDAYCIALHEGILSVRQCQMEGKPAMDAKSFYNGQGRNYVKETVE